MFKTIPTTDVYLYGELADKVGPHFKLGASTAVQAIRVLIIAQPKFRELLENGEWIVSRGNDVESAFALGEHALAVNTAGQAIHIRPAIGGAKNGGAVKTIIGAVIIVAAIAAAGPTGGTSIGAALAAEAFWGVTYGSIALFGGMIALSGIAQLMAKTPKASTPTENKDEPGYVYDGPVQTTQLGQPVKLCYGRTFAGTAIVSSTYSTEDIATQPGASSEAAGDGGDISGAGGGGKGGGGASNSAVEAPNTLRSRATISTVHVISEGPIHGPGGGETDWLKRIYLDGTPIRAQDGTDNFPNVFVQIRQGYSDQPVLEGFNELGSSDAVAVEATAENSPIYTSLDSDYDAFTVTIRLPALYKLDSSSGNMDPFNIHYRIDMRRNTGGPWVPVFEENLTGKTTSVYEKTIRINKYGDDTLNSIRLVRLSPMPASSAEVNQIFFQTLTKLRNNRVGFVDTAVMGIKVSADQFSTMPKIALDVDGIEVMVPANYDPTTRTYATTGIGTSGGMWDHASFKPAFSNNPIWVLLDMLASDRYGLGKYIPFFYNNLAELYVIAQYADGSVPTGLDDDSYEPRFTCDVEINQRAEALSYIQSVASIFRGMIYYGSGAITPVADMPKAPVKRMTNSKVINGKFKYTGSALNKRHSVVIVRWNDPKDMGRLVPERIEDIELIERFGYREMTVTAFGCRSRGQAIRVGKWILDSEATQTEAVVYQTGLDHSDIVPGNVIEIADQYYQGLRMGGRVKSYSNVAIRLDQPLTIEPGHTYRIGLETREGDALNYIDILNSPGTYDVVNVNQVPGGLKNGIQYIVKSSALAPRLFEVRSIKEVNKVNFEVNGLIYDPNKFARVELGIYIPGDPTSVLPDAVTPLSPPLAIDAYDYTYGVGTTTSLRVTISIQASNDPRVRKYNYRAVGSNGVNREVEAVGVSVDIDNLPVGNYIFSARAVGFKGQVSPWISTEPVIVDGYTDPPPPPTNIAAVGITRAVRLTWNLPATRLFKSIEIWRSSNSVFSAGNKIGSITSTNYVDMNLPVNTKYYYWLRTVDTLDQYSNWVGPVDGTTTLNIADDITDGIINTAKFAAGLTGVEIVAGFPVTGNYNGRFIVNTNDGKTYRYTTPYGNPGGPLAWQQWQDGTAIADGTVVYGKLSAGAVRAGEIFAGELRAIHMASETIITQAAQMGSAVIGEASIVDAAIKRAKIGDLEVDTIKIKNGSISANYAISEASPIGFVRGQADFSFSTLNIALDGDCRFIVIAQCNIRGGVAVDNPGPRFPGRLYLTLDGALWTQIQPNYDAKRRILTSVTFIPGGEGGSGSNEPVYSDQYPGNAGLTDGMGVGDKGAGIFAGGASAGAHQFGFRLVADGPEPNGTPYAILERSLVVLSLKR